MFSVCDDFVLGWQTVNHEQNTGGSSDVVNKEKLALCTALYVLYNEQLSNTLGTELVFGFTAQLSKVKYQANRFAFLCFYLFTIHNILFGSWTIGRTEQDNIE